MAIFIEIAVTDGVSNISNVKGKLLEELGKEALEIMQYDVFDRVRQTGTEIDLYAKHRITSELIYVECKAHRENLGSGPIKELIGTVTLKGVSSGWLFSTSNFGAEAKGLMVEWEKKPHNEQNKLILYYPERLIDLLNGVGRICKFDNLKIPQKYNFSNDHYLIITDFGRFFALPIIDDETGIVGSAMLFEASSGAVINDSSILSRISKVDTSLRELTWISGDKPDQIKKIPQLVEGRQNIVKVPSGEQWADYRPSRPQDFVGRQQIQTEVLHFLDAVREEKIRTRLISIKSPSGWGKSSLLLKLISRCENQRNRNKYFMFAVDCRAAASRRFGELALISSIEAAIINLAIQ